MTDKQALKAFVRGEALDQETINRLWRSGLVEVEDVTDHDTRPIGSVELMVTVINPEGKRLVETA
jgi:hypothetical protein